MIKKISKLPTKKTANRNKQQQTTTNRSKPPKTITNDKINSLATDNQTNSIIRLWINGLPSRAIAQRYGLTAKRVRSVIEYEKRKIRELGVSIYIQDLTDKINRLFYNHNQLSADITTDYMDVDQLVKQAGQLPMADRLKIIKDINQAIRSRQSLRSELRENDKVFFELVSKMGAVEFVLKGGNGSHTDNPTHSDKRVGDDIGQKMLGFDVGDKDKFLRELELSNKRTEDFLKKHKADNFKEVE